MFIVTSTLQAKHLHKEAYYQRIVCNKMNGIIEYELPNKTRIDCLTKTYAIEVDFAKKYYEAIGQSIYYALETNRKPGIILIVEKPNELKYIRRTLKVSKARNLELWTIDKNLIIKRITK